jgi:hypothetical protein
MRLLIVVKMAIKVAPTIAPTNAMVTTESIGTTYVMCEITIAIGIANIGPRIRITANPIMVQKNFFNYPPVKVLMKRR